MAADGESTQTKKHRGLGVRDLSSNVPHFRPRDSVRAMQDALAENYVCRRGDPAARPGASTLHDLPHAGQQGGKPRVDAFVHKSELDHAQPARSAADGRDGRRHGACLSNETSAWIASRLARARPGLGLPRRDLARTEHGGAHAPRQGADPGARVRWTLARMSSTRRASRGRTGVRSWLRQSPTVGVVEEPRFSAATCEVFTGRRGCRNVWEMRPSYLDKNQAGIGADFVIISASQLAPPWNPVPTVGPPAHVPCSGESMFKKYSP